MQHIPLDAAHTFGSFSKGKALGSYGDISTLSFHATKLFHTIEGGACIVREKDISDQIELIKRFGHSGDEHYLLGINAKQDEINAAMGLANFEYIDEIISMRKKKSEFYDYFLQKKFQFPKKQSDLEYNYAYYPVIFENENELNDVMKRLKNIDVHPRRYFYPSLNMLPYLKRKESCPVSENISSRILCLPLYFDLPEKIIEKICNVICSK